MTVSVAEREHAARPPVISYTAPVISTYSAVPAVLPAGIPSAFPATYPYPYTALGYARSVYGLQPTPFYF